MKTELFKKVHIKSVHDIPKKKGRYFTYNKNSLLRQDYGFTEFNGGDCNSVDYWINQVDWYLLPIEEENQGPTDEEIETAASDHASNYDEGLLYRLAGHTFKEAIEWFKSQIQSK